MSKTPVSLDGTLKNNMPHNSLKSRQNSSNSVALSDTSRHRSSTSASHHSSTPSLALSDTDLLTSNHNEFYQQRDRASTVQGIEHAKTMPAERPLSAVHPRSHIEGDMRTSVVRHNASSSTPNLMHVEPNKSDADAGQHEASGLYTSATSPTHANASSIASLRKRNIDFRTLFPTVPVGEILVDDYLCALQKDILMQGKMYISERHICFHANIFGWIVNEVIPFSNVVAIEKRNTAFVIPNAIQVVTREQKYFFASFLSRDSTYANIVDTWRRCMAAEKAASLLQELNGTNGSPESTSSVEASHNAKQSESISLKLIETGHGVYLEGYQRKNTSQEKLSNDDIANGHREDGNATATSNHDGAERVRGKRRKGGRSKRASGDATDTGYDAFSDGAFTENDEVTKSSSKPFLKLRQKMTSPRRKSVAAKASNSALQASVLNGHNVLSDSEISTHTEANGVDTNAASNDVTLKPLDADVECECSRLGIHASEKTSLDVVIDGTLPFIYNLLFGDDTSFMLEFHESQKNKNVNYGPWQKDAEGRQMRNLSYEMSLNNPLAPKNARAIITETVLAKDVSRSITVLTQTQTPDLPQGSNFKNVTRICMMRCANPNQTRILVTCKVEWKKTNWLKSTIEKGAFDGNLNFYRALSEQLKDRIARANNRAPRASIKAADSSHAPRPSIIERRMERRHRESVILDSAVAIGASETSLFRAIIGWFTPVRIFAMTVVFLCVCINIWCWIQLTDYRHADSTMSNNLRAIREDYHARWQAPPEVQENGPIRYSDYAADVERLLRYLTESGRQTLSKQPVKNEPTGEDSERQAYLTRLDRLQSRLAASYDRFRELDARMVELSRQLEDADREIRQIIRAVNDERQYVLREFNWAVETIAYPTHQTSSILNHEHTSTPSTSDDSQEVATPKDSVRTSAKESKIEVTSSSSDQITNDRS